jgi:hypothetical protein
LQAANRASGGLYAGDLFLLHTSQDQYSVFSLAVAPLVAFLGLPTAFFAGYLLASTAFLYAQIRLVRRCVDDRLVALASMVALAVIDLPYGGWGVFLVHEPFLTARLPASALVLFAIERSLAGRYGESAVALGVATAFHPLMALPGVAVIALRETLLRWRGAPMWMTLGLAGATASTCSALLGWMREPMNPDWADTVRRISPHCFPSDWFASDWVTMAAAGISLVAGAVLFPRHRALAVSLLAVAGGGLAISCATEWYPIPIVVQAQPMRALWLVSFFSIPWGFAVAARWWFERGWIRPLSAVALVVSVTRLAKPEEWVTTYIVLLAAIATVSAYVVQWVFVRVPRERMFLRSLALGVIASSVIVGFDGVIACMRVRSVFSAVTDDFTLTFFALRASGSAVVLLASMGVVMGWIARRLETSRVVGRAALVAIFALSLTGYQRLGDPFPVERSAQREVAMFLAGQQATSRELPTVYWPTDMRTIWFALPARSYFHFVQTQGAVFDGRTSAEIARRAHIVGPFERRRLLDLGGAGNVLRLGRLFGTPEPADGFMIADDLRRLADERDLDFILLPYEVPGFSGSKVGPLTIYDARSIRESTKYNVTRFSPKETVLTCHP